MNQVQIRVKLLPHYDNNFDLPKYQSTNASGVDLRAQLLEEKEKKIIIQPGERTLIPTGLSIEIPLGYEAQIRPRSGLSLKTGLLVVNSPGTIDADYRGEIKIIIGNLSNKPETINHGDRIAQMVIAPITQATFQLTDNLTITERGLGGFGHTGVQN